MFQVKIRYNKLLENGANKVVTDTYAVNALSFTEAEAMATEFVRPFISGNMEITGIAQVKYDEVWCNDMGANWYESQLEFITINEKSGCEKRTKSRILVQATTLQEAMAIVATNMRGTVADFEAVCIKQTPIVDYIQNNPKTN